MPIIYDPEEEQFRDRHGYLFPTVLLGGGFLAWKKYYGSPQLGRKFSPRAFIGFVKDLSPQDYLRKYITRPDKVELPLQRRLVETAVEYEKSKSVIEFLTDADLKTVREIGKAIPTPIRAEEMGFKLQVIRQFNPVTYDLVRNNPEKAQEIFNEILETVEDSKHLQSILKQQLERYRFRKSRLLIYSKFSEIINPEMLKSEAEQSVLMRQLWDTQKKQTQEARRLAQILQGESPETIVNLKIPKVLERVDPTIIIDERLARLQPAGKTISDSGIKLSHTGYKSFLQTLRRARVDSRAIAAIETIDPILKQHLNELAHTKARITYALQDNAFNLRAVIKLSIQTKEEGKREVINLKIPLTRGGRLRINGTGWIPQRYKGIKPLIPEIARVESDIYESMIRNLNKRFKSEVWHKVMEGDARGGERSINALIRDPINERLIMESGRPAHDFIEQTVIQDARLGYLSQRFGNDEHIILDRFKKMQKLKLLLLEGGGKLKLPNRYAFIDFETFGTKTNFLPHQVTVGIIENGAVVDWYTGKIDPRSININYDFPEVDLKFSFKGKTREQVIKEFTVMGQPISKVRRDLEEFLRKHAKGGKLPVAAWSAGFDVDRVMGQQFLGAKAYLGETWDPMDLQKAIDPDVQASVSLRSVGRSRKIFIPTSSKKDLTLNKKIIELFKKDRNLMSILKDKDPGFHGRLMKAVSEKQIRNLVMHEASIDVLVANKVFQDITKDINLHSAAVMRDLNTVLLTYHRALTRSINPVDINHWTTRALGHNFLSLSPRQILQGKFTKFDVRDLAPLTRLGMDPTRPFYQQWASAHLITKDVPDLVTKTYKKIADKYGELFKSMDTLTIFNPLTAENAGLIDFQTADEMAIKMGTKVIRIPHTGKLKLIPELKEAFEQIKSTKTPRDREIVLSKLRQKMAKSYQKGAHYKEWLPGFTLLGEAEGFTFNTSTPLMSVIENIEYNNENKEIAIRLQTATRSEKYGHPMKIFAPPYKGMLTPIEGLRSITWVDMILRKDLAKRGRMSFMLGQIQRLTRNFQAIHSKIAPAQTFQFFETIKTFVDKINSMGGIKLNWQINKGKLQFIDEITGKEWQKLDVGKIEKNWLQFSEGEWVKFMKEYSQKIRRMMISFGIKYSRHDPRLPYWTQEQIESMLSTEWGRRYPKKLVFAGLSKAEQNAFREKIEIEMHEQLSKSELSKFFTKAELTRWKSATLMEGHLSLIQLFGGSWGILEVTPASRAYEAGELYAKGADIKIPRLDELVVSGPVAQRIARTFTGEQRDMMNYMSNIQPLLRYGVLPESHYPIIKASEIKLDNITTHLGFREEIGIIEDKSFRIRCVETGEIFNSLEEVPDRYLKQYTLRPLGMNAYMHPKTLETMYGQQPAIVEFNIGNKKVYLPRPALSFIRGAPAKVTKSGDPYTIIGKEIQTFKNLLVMASDYEKIRGDEAKIAFERRFFSRVEDYKNMILTDKSTYIKITQPTIPGVRGKISMAFPPGMAKALGLPQDMFSHITTGFGVQGVSIRSMGEEYFGKAMGTHQIKEGPDVGRYRGATGVVYPNKLAFRKALIEGEELLAGTIIRTPAENRFAFFDTLVTVKKDQAAGMRLQCREAILTHFDYDGDIGPTVFADYPSGEQEQALKDLMNRQHADRELHKTLAERVKKLNANVLEYETSKDAATKKQIVKELERIQELEKTMNVNVYGQGIWVREARPTATPKEIKLGIGDEMRFRKMNLHQFMKELPSIDLPARLIKLPGEEMEQHLSNMLTKTATAYSYRKAMTMRAATKLFGGKLTEQYLDLYNELVGKVTAFKKVPYEKAEQITKALLDPEAGESKKIMGEVLNKDAELLWPQFKEWHSALNRSMMRKEVNELISSGMKRAPITGGQLALWGPSVDIPVRKARAILDFWGKEHFLSSFKRHGKKGGMAIALAALVAPIFLPHDNLYDKDGYPIIPTDFNVAQPVFPAPIHIVPNDPPTHPIRTFKPQIIDPLLIKFGSDNNLTTRRNSGRWPNKLKNY